MSSTQNPGRVAGFLYLLLVITGPFRLIYIPVLCSCAATRRPTTSPLTSRSSVSTSLAGHIVIHRANLSYSGIDGSTAHNS